jgi:hypothetical protein
MEAEEALDAAKEELQAAEAALDAALDTAIRAEEAAGALRTEEAETK